MMKIAVVVTVVSFALVNRADAQINRYSQPARQPITNTYVSPNFDAMKQALAAKQAQYDRELDACQKQTLEIYNSSNSYPAIQDGVHNATTIADGLVCASRKVFVQGGKVVNMTHEDGSLMPFSISSPIVNAKCMVGRTDTESGNTIYYKIYFIEDIFSK